jgi:hypothetical protein
MGSRPDVLFHFTCQHCAPHVVQDGLLLPITDQLTMTAPDGLLPLVWLTDLPVADRFGLGLTSLGLQCDRTERRFTVARTDFTRPWWRWRRAHPEHAATAQELESAPGARPRHWWVSEQPVPILAADDHG